MKSDFSSPRLPRWLLSKILHSSRRWNVLGDFEENYKSIQESEGANKARKWYWLQCAHSMPGALMHGLEWRADMIRHILKSLSRQLLRHKTYSTINIFGLSIGLACCILLFLYVAHELSYDRFHRDSVRIYRLEIEYQAQQSIRTAVIPFALSTALAREYPDIASQTRVGMIYQAILKEEKSHWETGGLLVDSTFFSVFDFELQRGDKHAALSSPNSLLLTESLAKKYFGDSDPLGKNMTLIFYEKKRLLTVTGLLKDPPSNSQIQFSFLAPLSAFYNEGELNDWGYWAAMAYIRLNPAGSAENLEKQFPAFLQSHLSSARLERAHDQLILQPLTDIHLHSKVAWEYGEPNSIRNIFFMSSIALAILTIACINFVNLTTARTMIRAKEIGIRKVVGAPMAQIIRQLFEETLILIFLAFIFGLCILGILMPVFQTILGQELSLTLFLRPSSVLVLTGFIIFISLTSGFYPAIQLSRLTPADMVRKQSMHAGRGRLRKLLTILQFGLSIGFIFSALIIEEQLRYISRKDLGYDYENILVISIEQNDIRNQANILKKSLEQNPLTSSVALAEMPMHQPYVFVSGWWEGKAEDSADLDFEVMYVDYDFFDVMGLRLVTGRTFDISRPSDPTMAYILNETAIREIGLKNPLQHPFRLESTFNAAKRLHSYGNSITGNIVGIVEDFHFSNMRNKIQPCVLGVRSEGLNFIYLRYDHKRLKETLQFIQSAWNDFATDSPLQIEFLDQQIASHYESQRRLFRILLLSAGLAIFIACMGIFGLSLFAAERRTKEIGIRKTLGASGSQILWILTIDFLKWVALSGVISLPAAYWLMSRWLNQFAYRFELTAAPFVLALFSALFLGFGAILWQSLRLAGTNPSTSLRYE